VETVLITSSTSEEGKSSTALNLAIAYGYEYYSYFRKHRDETGRTG
jgi:hypothetical protein